MIDESASVSCNLDFSSLWIYIRLVNQPGNHLKMARASNTEQRRLEIIMGLMKVMAEVGYEGATVPLIARAAGLTPGLIHYHFANKQSILIALIECLEKIVQKRFEALYTKKDPRKKLSAFVEAHVGLGDGADTTAVACWIAIGAEAVRQPEVRAAYQKVTAAQLHTLEKICEEILTESGSSIARRREIALGVVCAIEGAFRLLVSAPDLIVPGFALPTVKEMAFGLIKAQPLSSKRSKGI
jgi:TetR/AcrR family transcriptional regulator, transcriptional repressor of bet genes